MLVISVLAGTFVKVYECIQLSTEDVLVPTTMKNAAKCDT